MFVKYAVNKQIQLDGQPRNSLTKTAANGIRHYINAS